MDLDRQTNITIVAPPGSPAETSPPVQDGTFIKFTTAISRAKEALGQYGSDDPVLLAFRQEL